MPLLFVYSRLGWAYSIGSSTLNCEGDPPTLISKNTHLNNLFKTIDQTGILPPQVGTYPWDMGIILYNDTRKKNETWDLTPSRWTMTKRWKLRILQIDTPMQLPNGTLGVTIVIINHESDRTFIFHDTPVIQSDWYTKGSTKYRCGKPNGERRSEIDLHWWVVHIVSLQNGIWENIMGIWDLMESFMRSNVIFPGNFVWYDIAFTHVASAVSVLNLHEASSELYRFIPWFNYEI